MKVVKVNGNHNKHKVLMYALSTCAWCKRTKQFLKDNNIEYEYVDVDLSDGEDRKKIADDIKRRGGEVLYPTLIIDDKRVINGFLVNDIKEALEIEDTGTGAAKG